MTTKRDYGSGTITKRGEDAWRLRYRVGAERVTRPSGAPRPMP